jgi:ABC-2 type transport system permease protein
MSTFFAVCLARTKLQLLANLQYPLGMAIWQVGVVLQPVISLVVWSAVARAGTGEIAGYRPTDFVAYFLVLMVVYRATYTSVMYEIEWRIRRGDLSALLLQPTHPISVDIAHTVGANLHALLLIVPAAGVLAVIFQPTFHWLLWSIAAGVLAMILAAGIRFLIEYTLGFAAFWITRLGAINGVYYAALLFFSGQFVPLTLLPLWVQRVVAWLPFRWILAFPVELVLGKRTPGEALQGLAVQAGWLVASLVMMVWVWQRGVQRYGAVGG